jgi:hypothetical protein
MTRNDTGVASDNSVVSQELAKQRLTIVVVQQISHQQQSQQ